MRCNDNSNGILVLINLDAARMSVALFGRFAAARDATAAGGVGRAIPAVCVWRPRRVRARPADRPPLADDVPPADRPTACRCDPCRNTNR